MQRLSRSPWWIRVAAFFAVLVFLAAQSFFVYCFTVDRRIRRELANRSWREPTVILSSAGSREREVARVYGPEWRATPPVLLEQLPPHVPNAFLAAEDIRFRRHPGIEPIGIGRATFVNLREGSIAQGGSTIPQQIVKQRFLSNERTWRRKLVEGVLAILLDVRLTKDQMLEVYLNDVYLGHHRGRAILGIDDAARLYFDKPPTALRLDEAALLAAMVRAPNRDTPEKRPAVVRSRRDAILETMRGQGWVTDAEAHRARSRGVDVARGSLPEVEFPFYVRALRADVVEAVGERRVSTGRLTITCEMDPDAQRAAERAVRRTVDSLVSRHRWIRSQSREDPLQAAVLSVDPADGGVRALVGGSDFRRSPLDRTENMRRQPGSAFKTFAYLTAIASRRVTNTSFLLDSPLTVALSGGDDWRPQNYDQRYRGRVTLREAFERSLNVPAVRLAQDVGTARVARTARSFGFAKVSSIPAMSLGVDGVTMRELTAAYTAFPNLGEVVEPFLLRRVRDGRGRSLFEHTPERRRVAEAAPIYVVHSLLRGVVRRGTASRLSRYGLGTAAGKTGTTNDYRDAWFVGYTENLVTTAWVGFDRGAPLRLSSSEAALPLWGAYMRAIPHPAPDPEPPAGVVFRDIDPESGMLWREGCPGPVREVFLDGTEPRRPCPRGVFGRILRRVVFDDEHFDEPAAISVEQFRRWTREVERNRREIEGVLDRLRRLLE